MLAGRSTERQLLIRYQEGQDLRAREELVKRFLPLAGSLAHRYSHTDEPYEDLLQVACLGLLKALDRFDPFRGTKFTAYAVPTMLGELKRHFRDESWAVHVPRQLQERAMAVKRESETLATQLGRSPSVREVAEALGMSVEEALEGQEAASSYEAASLDAPVRQDEAGAVPLVETLGADDGSYELVENRDAVARNLTALNALEREVLTLRFVRGLTQREIGMCIGCSQMHVSRLLRRALDRLETAATAPAVMTPAAR